jgi:tetratricopeptide (TPR) repeat protein
VLPNTSHRLSLGMLAIVLASLAAMSVSVHAQSTNSTAGTKLVKAASLPVYSQMDPASEVVRKLKKGDRVVLGFEVGNASGRWCSVSLPGGHSTLGYVQCSGLDLAALDSTVRKFAATDAGFGGETIGSSSTSNSPIHPQRGIHLAPPSERTPAAYERVAKEVVGEDGIDDAKLDELDQAAQGGSPAAVGWAAVGHDAAGQYAMAHHDTAQAVTQFQAAVDLAGKQPEILFPSLLNLAYAHLDRSEFQAALGPLLRAEELMPSSVAAARYAGWAYYELSQPDKAVAEWRKAQQVAPDPTIQRLLQQAERDQKTERAFQQGATAHFVLHYEGGAAPGLAQNVLLTLEEEFQEIQTLFHYTPPEQIGVVLYTNREFEDVTRAPSWSAGLNDGRIRVPVQGLTTVTPDLARVLKHELTHSFVAQMTERQCPTWLQEGLAQWVEGRRTSPQVAQALLALHAEKNYIPVSHLAGSWTGLTGRVASFAYAWSLATVEGMMQRSEMWGMKRLLADIATGEPTQQALSDALRTNYEQLDQQTIQYLKQTYPN